jgi:ABC-2 type transport system ATP-binding protein
MLEINELSFRYKSAEELFKGLNLQLKAGSIYGLLGRNGAGKTTLLRLIAGMLFPDTGDCHVLGFNPQHRLPQFLQEIYFIPEEFYVPPITADTYVNLYAPFYKNFDRKIFQDSINEFGLPTDKELIALSYGQKKKFLVVFGLATNCKFLLLDEPTNGLDIPSKSQFRKLLASMLTKDKAFIIATHQVRDLETLIDTVVIIDEGKIIFNQPIYEAETNLEVLFNDVVSKEGVK